MKKIQKTYYVCEICNQHYISKEKAEECESKPLQSSGVKIGDTVKILSGDCTGDAAVVEEISICDRNWGHYMADRYWHTERVFVDFPNGLTRVLTFDAFEKVKE